MLGHRYELRALLGTGAMAQVWSATDRNLGRVVAVKLLHPHLVADGPSVERFRREAIAVAALSHPNIVAVFDTLFGDGAEAIVMEYVDGGTLRSALDERGAVSQSETVQLGAKVANALSHAHGQGVIHRDIKPANILLTRDGVPKLTDFGIAKGSAETDLTVVGTIIGTPSYLAPEHVQNRTVDRRADLYSLCVVLYEMLAGRPPFIGDDSTAVALARLHQDPPPIRQLVPSIDPALAAVLMRGLERSPDRRFQSAADLERALRSPNSAISPPIPTPIPTPFGESAGESAGEPVERTVDDRDRAQGFATATEGVRDDGSVDHDETLPEPAAHDRPRRSILAMTLLTVLCLGPLAVLAALVAAPLTQDTPTTTTDPNPSISIVPAAAVAFDPLGDGTEHPETVANLIDGDASTAWTTERYNNQRFGTKAGVGFIVDLGESHDIDEVQFDTVAGWSGYLAITQTDPTAGGVVPDPTKSIAATSDRLGVSFNGVPGRYVTVWIEDLGPAVGGRHMVTVSEVSLIGRRS